MKNGKRIAAFALSLVVALGSVCYRPPKAEAVIFESAAVIPALLSTYLSGTGFSFAPGANNMDADAANEAIVTSLLDKYNAFCDYMKGDPAETREMLLSGSEFFENGVVWFSSSVAAWLGQFSAWLIDKLGLGGGIDVPIVWNSLLPPPIEYMQENIDSGERRYFVYFNAEGELLLVNAYKAGSITKSDTGVIIKNYNFQRYKVENGNWVYMDDKSGNTFLSVDYTIGGVVWTSFDLCDSEGNIYVKASEYGTIVDEESPIITVAIPTDYEAAPDVDEQYAMVVDTGLTFADEQSYIDAILGGVAAGTLSPTYTIEETTAGDVTVPGEDAEDDTQVGILNWVKKIWQSVKELPQTIADAVANVFVPSEEYMATVPETIADAFGSRTGFLTYPTSVLYDFVDMLSETSGDFILSWPTVREPSTGGVMMEAGQFNVSKFVRDNQSLSDWYIIYRYAVGAYLTFLFFGLCRRKYNSVVGDRLGV